MYWQFFAAITIGILHWSLISRISSPQSDSEILFQSRFAFQFISFYLFERIIFHGDMTRLDGSKHTGLILSGIKLDWASCRMDLWLQWLRWNFETVSAQYNATVTRGIGSISSMRPFIDDGHGNRILSSEFGTLRIRNRFGAQSSVFTVNDLYCFARGS